MAIHLMCGIPGSGKSTLAKSLQVKNHGLPSIVCPDEFRMVLTGQEFYGPAEDMVWSHVKTTARILLKERDIIVDATNTTPYARSQWTKLAKGFEGCEVYAHAVVVPLDIVTARNEGRNRVVPNDVINGMARKFEVPSLAEGFETVSFYNKDLVHVGYARRGEEHGKGYTQFTRLWTFPYDDESEWSDI